MTSSVEDWLNDISLPTPDPADIAVYVAQAEGVSRFAGAGARAALLRLAKMLVQMHGYLKDAQRRNETMFAAVQDSARTSVIAIERLQQQEGLVKAAVAARRAQLANDATEVKHQSQRIRDEAEKLRLAEDKRS